MSRILARLNRNTLAVNGPLRATITNVEHLSSYNWIEAPRPTIAVPGIPPLWSPPTAPQKLNRDTGFHYVDENAARYPESPLEPLFRALYIANPSFDVRSIDVVTDQSNILKLYLFLNPGFNKKELRTFIINVHVVKNTAIFCPRRTATFHFSGSEGSHTGFSNDFGKAYTTKKISGSTECHRIISYRFSDLNFIVRHRTNGYIDPTSSFRNNEPESDCPSIMMDDCPSIMMDDCPSNMMDSLSQSSNDDPLDVTSAEPQLIIRKVGHVVPLESIVEIKTRNSRNPLQLHTIAPELWTSQIFRLVQAYHRKGTFGKPLVRDVGDYIKIWEEENQDGLRKLAALIKEIIYLAKVCGGKAYVRYEAGEDWLVVQTDNGKDLLPKSLYSKWDDEDDFEAENTKLDAGAEISAESVDGVEPEQERKTW